jgi:divalent metal cation (Fe/Co/Zn/Cd) transporter
VVTAAVMFTLAAGKTRTGAALDTPVLRTAGRVTMIDGILAVVVLLGLLLNAAAGWWRADPAAGYVLVCYAAREARDIFTGRRRRACGDHASAGMRGAAHRPRAVSPGPAC